MDSRKTKGINERMLLIEKRIEQNEIQNDVLSQTNNIYTITINRTTI